MKKGEIVIKIGCFIQHPDSVAHGTMAELKPIKYDLPENNDDPTALPAGMIKELKEVLGELCKLARNHTHAPLTEAERVNLVHTQPKIITTTQEPSMEVYQQTPFGMVKITDDNIKIPGIKDGK